MSAITINAFTKVATGGSSPVHNFPEHYKMVSFEAR